MQQTLDDTIDETETETSTTTASTSAAASVLPPATGMRVVDPLDLYLEREPGVDYSFDGDYIYFNGQTGVWTRGPNKDRIGATVPFLTNPNEILLGWIKLVPNDKGKMIVEDRVTGRMANGYERPPREKLGDLDSQKWPHNRDGKREDPWKEVTYLPMRCQEDGEPCIYAPFADTARAAVKAFVYKYRNERINHPGKYPVVVLVNTNFKNNHGGLTYKPKFQFGDWEYWDGQPALELTPVTVPIAVPIAPSATAKLAAPKHAGDDMNDEIPF
jgi:hypothetical protein